MAADGESRRTECNENNYWLKSFPFLFFPEASQKTYLFGGFVHHSMQPQLAFNLLLCNDDQWMCRGPFHTCASKLPMRRKATDERAVNKSKHLWLSLHPVLSILLLSSQSLPSATSCSRLRLLSLANGSLREGLMDKCAAIMSACTNIH